MRRAVALLALILLVAFASSEATARDRKKGARGQKPRYAPRANLREHNIVREEGRNVIYKKRNVVEFDNSLIEGDVRNPSEFYFVHRPEEKFGTLVKRRPNFHKEMLRDTVMIR